MYSLWGSRDRKIAIALDPLFLTESLLGGFHCRNIPRESHPSRPICQRFRPRCRVGWRTKIPDSARPPAFGPFPCWVLLWCVCATRTPPIPSNYMGFSRSLSRARATENLRYLMILCFPPLVLWGESIRGAHPTNTAIPAHFDDVFADIA